MEKEDFMLEGIVTEYLKKELIKKINSLSKTIDATYKKDRKNIIDNVGVQQGESLDEKIFNMIQGLKKPQYTQHMLRSLKTNGYEIEVEDDIPYIIYKINKDKVLKYKMPSEVVELCRELELLDSAGQIKSYSNKDLLDNVIINILTNMYFQMENGNMDKKALEEITEGVNIEPYSILVDSNGSIGVDINKQRYYLPIRVSKKMLSLGALQDEQALIQEINDTLGNIIKSLTNQINENNFDEYRLIKSLKENRDKIKFIDGRYCLEDPNTKVIVELSVEQNDAIMELENNIFNKIRDSFSYQDNNGASIDFSSYDALLELISLGFVIEKEATKDGRNRIIVTSVTGREFIKEQSDFIDVDFSKLPFIQEKNKTTRSFLSKEDLERELKSAKEIDSQVLKLMQKFENTIEKTSEEKKNIEEVFIKKCFLDSSNYIEMIDGRYYIQGKDFSVPLTKKQRDFILKLEDELFETIYKSKKEADVDGKDSVVQDINGYNTLIEMLQLGYYFNIETDKNNNIINDRIVIKSPTGKTMKRSFSDFGHINMEEIPWEVQKDNKTGYLSVERLKKYIKIAEFINNTLYSNLNLAKNSLENDQASFLQKEQSLKCFFDSMLNNDYKIRISYVDGNYCAISEEYKMSIPLNEELSSQIKRLSKEYVEVLYWKNKAVSRDIQNGKSYSKEEMIEDVKAYFSERGIELNDIENKMAVVFDENGERISIDLNSQKTIIELLKLGYKFSVKDKNIHIITPFGDSFNVSVEEFNKKGLPHTPSMFALVEKFAKSEEKNMDYSTINFYNFLMKEAKVENIARLKEGIQAKKRFKLAENTRELNSFIGENIIKKIEEIQEIKPRKEEYIKQLIAFYKNLKSNKSIVVKYNYEKEIYEVKNNVTKACYDLSDEESKALKLFGSELSNYMLDEEDKEQSGYGIKTVQLSGLIQLLELGFAFKRTSSKNKTSMYVFDPFDTDTGKSIESDEIEHQKDRKIDESRIEHYKGLLEIAKSVNKNLKQSFENIGETNEQKFSDILQFLQNCDEINKKGFMIDWVDLKDGKDLCFVNPKNKLYIRLTDKQKSVLNNIKNIFEDPELYKRLERHITGEVISNTSEDELGRENNLINPHNKLDTSRKRIIDSFKMYKLLREIGLEIRAYEGGITRVGIEFPWNETLPLNPNSIKLLTENPIDKEVFDFDSAMMDTKELEMLHLLFSQGLEEKFALFNEYFEFYSSKGKHDAEIIDFLMERAEIYYKMEYPFKYLGKAVSNTALTVTKIPKLSKNAAFRLKQRFLPKVTGNISDNISDNLVAEEDGKSEIDKIDFELLEQNLIKQLEELTK